MEWIAAVVTYFGATALIGAVLWLFKNLIITRLTNSVRHEFNEKLEKLRSELRKQETAFRADLDAKEKEITDLRSGALSTMVSRQVALDKRRLDAVDQLWSAATKLSRFKGQSGMMSAIKFAAMAEEAERNPEARRLFEPMSAAEDLKKIDLSEAAAARPYVSPMAWALFSAYQAILVHAVMQIEILKLGMPAKFVDTDVVRQLVAIALPELSENVDTLSDTGFHFVLETLENHLLSELQAPMTGEQSNDATVAQAQKILERTKKVMEAAAAAEAEKRGEKPQ